MPGSTAGGTPAATLNRYRRLAGHTSGETGHTNHRAFVETARDEFIRVACLDLEGYLSAFRLDDAGGAGDWCAEGRGSKMSQFNFQSNCALIRIEERVERFPRSAFDQADEPWCAEDGRHALGSKVNDVLRAYDEAVFAKGATGWARFHCLGKPPALPEDSRVSTILGMVRVLVSNGNPIPLTLTHGEREQSASGSVVREVSRADTALGCAEGQWRILPLPKGEGRGEGKGDARCVNRV